MLRFLPGRQARHTEPAVDRLDGWKEIAAYLRRDVRTVQRWEKEENLPIQRHLHSRLGTVYAYKPELDAWWNNRGTDLEQNQPMDRSHFWEKNKKTTIGITMGIVLALLAGLVAWMDIGSSSSPKGLSFQERDWVLITDFENRTGESVFDGVLEYSLEREINNSQFVNVVPRERIEDTLRLMRKPLDTRIDRTLGREICLRDGGIRALLTGRVEKLDSTYLLSVQVVDPSQGQAIATASEEAMGQKQVLSALRSLSNWVRQNLGEKLALIQESERKLEKVATPSLRALQLFTEARTLFDRGSEGQGPAEELLKQAVEIDPEFASAYIWLAWTLKNQGESLDDYIQHAERAFQLAGTTSEQERYFIQGSYYWMKDGLDRAIHAFEALLSLYPDHFWATTKLVTLYRETGQDREALNYRVRLADLRPKSFLYTRIAASQLLRAGDRARAKTYLQRVLDLVTPEDLDSDRAPNTIVRLMWFPAFEALLHADPETALREANRSLERLRSFERRRFVNDSPMGAFYLTLGKIERAREWFKENTEPGNRRQIFLAATAYVEEDHEAMTEHLKQVLKAQESLRRTQGSVRDPDRTRRQQGSPVLASTVVLLLTRGGFPKADFNPTIDPGTPDFILERIEKQRDIRRGMLALSQDNRIEELKVLGNALSSISLTDSGSAATYFMGSEILAEAWKAQGEPINAVEVLRAALEKESFLLLDQSVLTGPLWLKLQAQLSQLYLEMGRYEDARKIEGNLRKQLALADHDHPILRQLDRTKELASSESER